MPKTTKKLKNKREQYRERMRRSQKKKHQLFINRQQNIHILPSQRISELMNKNKRLKQKHTKRRRERNTKKLHAIDINRNVSIEFEDDFLSDMNESQSDSDSESFKDISQKSKKMKDDIHQRLNSGQFRWLNEMLYKTTGAQAMININDGYEQAFKKYHETYYDIVHHQWPESPLEKLIKSTEKLLMKYASIKAKKKKSKSKLKRKKAKKTTLTMVDFGCGDAQFAQYFLQKRKRNQRKYSLFYSLNIYSYDLLALNKFVTVCDMSHTPLDDGSVDLCIFCLSLMGINFHEYLIEAFRILKSDGILKIAEVRSRFYGIQRFERFLNRCGFEVKTHDLGNTHFVIFHCQKSGHKQCQNFSDNFDATGILKPCLYKKR